MATIINMTEQTNLKQPVINGVQFDEVLWENAGQDFSIDLKAVTGMDVATFKKQAVRRHPNEFIVTFQHGCYLLVYSYISSYNGFYRLYRKSNLN